MSVDCLVVVSCYFLSVLKNAKTTFLEICVVAVKLSFDEADHALSQNLFMSKMMRNLFNYSITKIKIKIRFSDVLPATEVFFSFSPVLSCKNCRKNFEKFQEQEDVVMHTDPKFETKKMVQTA
jgi:hypothetical protein